MVARQLLEPRTVNWIASEAGWSHESTKRILERLVDGGISIVTTAASTLWTPQLPPRAVQEVIRLRDNTYTVEDLTVHLVYMKTQTRLQTKCDI